MVCGCVVFGQTCGHIISFCLSIVADPLRQYNNRILPRDCAMLTTSGIEQEEDGQEHHARLLCEVVRNMWIILCCGNCCVVPENLVRDRPHGRTLNNIGKRFLDNRDRFVVDRSFCLGIRRYYVVQLGKRMRKRWKHDSMFDLSKR